MRAHWRVRTVALDGVVRDARQQRKAVVLAQAKLLRHPRVKVRVRNVAAAHACMRTKTACEEGRAVRGGYVQKGSARLRGRTLGDARGPGREGQGANVVRADLDVRILG